MDTASGGDPQSAIYKDNFIPRFENTTASYKEWRKRIALYGRRMKQQNRSTEVGLNVLSTLTGASWRQCEDLSLDQLEKENGLDIILTRLDKQWQYDDKVEMPEAFEKYFFKMNRQPGQTLLTYCTDSAQALRELTRYDVKIPDEVAGWLLLRRSGLTKEQKQLIQTTVGIKLKVAEVEKALYTILGQDHVSIPAGQRQSKFHGGRRWRNERVQYAEDEEEAWNDEEAYATYEASLEANETYDDSWNDDQPEWGYYTGDYEFDAEAAYYNDEPTDESLFDVEAYDVAFATYVDAKKKMNALRSARGFWPVVAVPGDNVPANSVPVMSQRPFQPSSSSKSKGKNHKGKGKSKTSSFSKGKGTAKQRSQSFMDQMCVRCGQYGHNVSNCPTKSSSSSSHPNKKRAADDSSMVAMALPTEPFSNDHWITKDPDACIQDGGASTFLVGSEYLLRYLKWLEHIGFDVQTIPFKRTDKPFKFGGDGEGRAKWMAQLPVNLGGKVGRIQCHVIFGSTPMLLGRPILEMMNAVVDFGNWRMKLMDGNWQSIRKGRHGAMLLRLAEEVNHPQQLADPVFDLVNEEDDHDETERFDDYLEDMKARARYASLGGIINDYVKSVQHETTERHEEVHTADDPETNVMHPNEVAKIVRLGTQQEKENQNAVKGMVMMARRNAPVRQKLVWEVYSGEGQLTKELDRQGARTERFGLANGWDFSKASHRKALLDKARADEPDEIFMSPKCTLWSPMQNINIHNDEDAEILQERRERDHETHLTMCRRLYLQQVQRGCHAHIEHPERSKAWKTKAFRDLPGYHMVFDQCMYGTMTVDDEGLPALVRKATGLRTTKHAMAVRMQRRCDKSHFHQQLEGNIPGSGVPRCRAAENYGPELARHFAAGILADEGLVEQVYMGEDETDEQTGVLKKLAANHGEQAARIAHRLHRNLGHPRTETLLKILEEKNASEKVKKAVRDLKCTHCQNFAPKKTTSPTSLDRSKEFNGAIQCDVLWLEMGSSKKRLAILSMVDEATRFMAARIISDETAKTMTTAVERAWIRDYGPMKILKVDEASAWGSDVASQWSENHGIELKISPGQSHSRTSIVERRHQLLRRALQIYMEDNKVEGLEGLREVVPSLNQFTFVNGYTPTQLALGNQPHVPGLLTDERTQPQQLSEESLVREKLNRRSQGQIACAKAEVDVKLRRALLRQFRGQEEDLNAGERCLYWREANNRFHTIRWKGPAVVVAVQRDPDSGQVVCYWLAHGTVLIRAGKQHVKRLLDQDGRMASSTEALEGLRQRRVVRVLDLPQVNRRSLQELDPEDEEEELTEEPPASPNHQLQQVQAAQVPEPQEPESDQLPTTDPDPPPIEPHLTVQQEHPPHQPELPSEQLPSIADGVTDTSLPPVPDDDFESAEENEEWLDRFMAADHTATFEDAPNDPSFTAPSSGETFEERRRRLNLQETVWLRTRQPRRELSPDRQREDRQQKRTRTEEPEIGLMAMQEKREAGQQDLVLPEGWTYDKQNDEFILGDTQDFWTVEEGFLVRNHAVGREETFQWDRGMMETCPVKVGELQPYKITINQDNPKSMMVEKFNSPSQKLGREPWMGATVFPLNRDKAKELNMPCVNMDKKMRRLKGKDGLIKEENLVSEEVFLSTLPMKKKDNAADLRESKMTLEDRLKFMEGKKAELASIFENGVWHLEANPETVDSSRILKARFVLKWANDGKGNLKAKARLVLQGFSDPDLLSGKLETSSPTLNRTSRQVMLSIMSIMDWSAAVADVSTAFLQGDPQHRELWAKLPRDACQLLNVPAGSLMKLIKPIYGQADAPKAWYVVAKRRLESVGFVVHPLDGCLFRLFDEKGGLTAMIGLHVDDMFITGDLKSKKYKETIEWLKEQFSFKHWTEHQEGKPLEFCGCELDRKDGVWTLSQGSYIKKVHPITVSPQMSDSKEVGPREVSALRGILGGLQWPATQTSPHLSATVSLLCGEVTRATAGTLRAANKALRFAKENGDVGLKFFKLGDPKDLAMVAMSDAAWGVRADGQSQGGYLVVLTHRKAIQGEECPCVVLDWRSYRLPRVSRSSLNAEAQACAGAMDAMEYLMTFWQGCFDVAFELRNPGETGRIQESALVIDAKALYDSLKAEVPQIQGDKRTKIEAMIIKEKMKECGTEIKWVSSEVQYSDGLTKQAARQLLADRLRTHVLKLTADTDFQAAKKKTPAERQKNARKYAMTRASMKIGGLAHVIFLANMVATADGAGEETTEKQWIGSVLATLLMMALISNGLMIQILRFCTSMIWQRFIRPKLITTVAQSLHDEKLLLQEEIEELQNQVQQSRQFARKFREQYEEAEIEIDKLQEEVHEQRRHITNVEFTVDLLREEVARKEHIIHGKNEVIQRRNEVLDRLRAPPSVYKTQRGSRYHCSTSCSHLTNSSKILELKKCLDCGWRYGLEEIEELDGRFYDAEWVDPELHDYEEM